MYALPFKLRSHYGMLSLSAQTYNLSPNKLIRHDVVIAQVFWQKMTADKAPNGLPSWITERKIPTEMNSLLFYPAKFAPSLNQF